MKTNEEKLIEKICSAEWIINVLKEVYGIDEQLFAVFLEKTI